ncbi:GntR family transcriptional regulator [Nonomuraea sp. CA-218870]|uniref:GntR family transcriptional regulator n=1 Tax=Nonomuraea sp. CA-218870 TaxID=3239998 RepID=UPI003D91FB4F
MAIDLLGPDPIYQQIAAVILERIKDGTYELNRAIPSEAEMCDEFSVSRNTVRAAIRSLNKQGAVRTVRGRGTFVAAQPPQ